MNIQIKETTELDLPNLQRLWADGEVMKNMGFPHGLFKSLPQLKRWLKTLKRKNAKDYSIYSPELSYCGETYYRAKGNLGIVDIKLFPKARGKGIAAKALSFAIKEAFRAGVNHVFVNPFDVNTKAIELYHKLGFKEIKRVKIRSHKITPPSNHTIHMLLYKY